MKQFTIKNGTIPPRGGRKVGAPLKYPWPKMKKNQFFVAGKKTKALMSVATSGNNWAKAHKKNRKFAQRTIKGKVFVYCIK